MMVGRKKYAEVIFNMERQTVKPKKAIKYLGVYIDRGLTFTEHVRQAYPKSGKSQRALLAAS